MLSVCVNYFTLDRAWLAREVGEMLGLTVPLSLQGRADES
jgi:hypothetical protein